MALLTGQRPADVLQPKHTDIRDGARWIVQNKTETRMGRGITGDLVAICRPKALALNPYSATPTR